MKTALPVLLIAAALAAGCGKDDAKPAKPAETNAAPNYGSGNPVTAPVDYLGAVVQAQKHAEKVIDVSSLNQAIQLFQASEGRLPKTLEELVPNYIGKIPAAPVGSKIVYDPAAGSVKVLKQ